jgi:hypothetical protein
MSSAQSQRNLKALLHPPPINLASPKGKPSTASHSRFASTSLGKKVTFILFIYCIVTSNSALGGNSNTFDVTMTQLPLSPKPTSSMIIGQDELSNRSHKSVRLIKRISSFAKNASKEFETKVKMINNIEKRKIQAIQTDKIFISNMHSANSSPTFQSMSPHNALAEALAKTPSSTYNEEIRKQLHWYK